jgi:type IV secretion system protein TrbI
MLTEKPEYDDPAGTPPEAPPAPQQPTAGGPEPLTGHSKPPMVKRFNRRTLAVLTGIVALATILALSKAFEPPRRATPAEVAEQTAEKKAPAPPDSIAALPANYADTPRLGKPVVGDMAQIAAAQRQAAGPGADPNLQRVSTATPAGMPRALTPLEQYEQAQALQELKRQREASDASPTFGGTSIARGVADPAADLVKLAQAYPAGASVPGAPQQPRVRDASRDTDNRQDDKTEFLDQDHDSAYQLKRGLQPLRSPYTLLASAVIPGVLLNAVHSDLPGRLRGQVSQNVYDSVTGRHLLIPQGSTVLGAYDSRVTYGQSRLLVVWERICLPNGKCISLEGMSGVDMSGMAGLTGDVDYHYWRLIGGVVLGSVLGASAQIAQGGLNSTNPSFGQLASAGAGQNINQAGQAITRKNLQVQPTIIINEGERFQIFTTRDIELEPYSG